MPGNPVHHLQLEFTQTHVHQVADAIQSSHPLSSPSPPAKAREFQKDIYFCFIDYAKAFDCVDHNTLWKILKEMGISDHLTCLLRNLYAGQEATVRTGHGTTDWFQIGKGVCQGCILSPCLFNFLFNIMRNAGLEETQAGIKIAGRNINNLRYADDTTLLSSSQILTPSEQLLSSREAVSVTSDRAISAC